MSENIQALKEIFDQIEELSEFDKVMHETLLFLENQGIGAIAAIETDQNYYEIAINRSKFQKDQSAAIEFFFKSEGDVIAALKNFIEHHPDFSYNYNPEEIMDILESYYRRLHFLADELKIEYLIFASFSSDENTLKDCFSGIASKNAKICCLIECLKAEDFMTYLSDIGERVSDYMSDILKH